MSNRPPASFEQQPTEKGEPVFDAPWQAKAFAMTVKLNESGVFTWTEWADRLSKHIAEFETHSKINNSDDYYTLWQSALESLVDEKTGSTKESND